MSKKNKKFYVITYKGVEIKQFVATYLGYKRTLFSTKNFGSFESIEQAKSYIDKR